MIPCPSCQKSVEILDKHWGTLFTCPHCNAVYFVDWNGQPEMVQHEEAPLAEEAPILEETPTFDEAPPIEEVPTSEVVSFEDIPSYEEFVPLEPNGPLEDFVATPHLPETSEVASSAPDFAEVVDFANSDTSSGPFTYTIEIEGIESHQLRALVREAMTDSRFGWDVDELLNTLDQGRLILRSLNPAKASVIISRVRYLPFKISWRQDVLSSS